MKNLYDDDKIFASWARLCSQILEVEYNAKDIVDYTDFFSFFYKKEVEYKESLSDKMSKNNFESEEKRYGGDILLKDLLANLLVQKTGKMDNLISDKKIISSYMDILEKQKNLKNELIDINKEKEYLCQKIGIKHWNYISDILKSLLDNEIKKISLWCNLSYLNKHVLLISDKNMRDIVLNISKKLKINYLKMPTLWREIENILKKEKEFNFKVDKLQNNYSDINKETRKKNNYNRFIDLENKQQEFINDIIKNALYLEDKLEDNYNDAIAGWAIINSGSMYGLEWRGWDWLNELIQENIKFPSKLQNAANEYKQLLDQN